MTSVCATRAISPFVYARRIVEGIRRNVPEAAHSIQSVMHRSAKCQDKIIKLNGECRARADEFGAGYLDLSRPKRRVGALRKDYTLGSLHRTGAGNKAWAEVLRPLV